MNLTPDNPESDLVRNYRRAYLALHLNGTQEEKDRYLKTHTSADQACAFGLGTVFGLLMAVSCGIWIAVA